MPRHSAPPIAESKYDDDTTYLVRKLRTMLRAEAKVSFCLRAILSLVLFL